MGPEELKRELANAQHNPKVSKDPEVIVVSAGRTWNIEKLWIDSCGDINIDITPRGRS